MQSKKWDSDTILDQGVMWRCLNHVILQTNMPYPGKISSQAQQLSRASFLGQNRACLRERNPTWFGPAMANTQETLPLSLLSPFLLFLPLFSPLLIFPPREPHKTDPVLARLWCPRDRKLVLSGVLETWEDSLGACERHLLASSIACVLEAWEDQRKRFEVGLLL